MQFLNMDGGGIAKWWKPCPGAALVVVTMLDGALLRQRTTHVRTIVPVLQQCRKVSAQIVAKMKLTELTTIGETTPLSIDDSGDV